MNEYRKRHTELLARPFKHNQSKKYDPTKFDRIKWKNYKHPVYPIKNKRLHRLNETPKFKQNHKYEIQPDPSTCVSRAVLEAVCAPRMDHLCRPFVRSLKATKKEFAHFGQHFVDLMNERINMSFDTIYYHNIKSLMNIAAQKLKNRKIPPVKKKCWDECGDRERMESLATPKKVPRPRKLRKRKWKKLIYLLDRIDRLSTPRLPLYRRPSQDSVLKRFKVSPMAMKYITSDRIKKLTKLPDFKLVPPWIPVAVKPSALEYMLTKRTKALAEPRMKSKVESDEKENPYDINPFALKYKASKRMVELSKPVER